jgi:type I restriction enzyme S subunit
VKETGHAPESWARCSLADIVVLNPKNDASIEKMAGFVPMALAPTDYHGTLQHEEKLWGEIKKSYTNFADGDVIFAKVTPCFENGKAAIVSDMPSGIGAGSSEFYVLRPASKEISPNLIFAIIKEQQFMQQGAQNMTGAVGLRRVPRAFVETFPVALPPVAEQKVIADKLDTLLAQVENTKARLESIPKILKRFRQSVLAAAVNGRLTEGWRNGAGFNVESGKLGRFVSIDIGHAFKSKEFTDQGIPLLRGQNIEPGALRWTETKYFPGALLSDFHHLFIDADDIVLAMDRPIISSGLKVARAKLSDLPCVLVQRVARFKKFEGLLPSYLYILLQDISFSNYIQPNQTGSDIPHISGKQILAYPVEVPNIEEQTEIVCQVDQLFAHADHIEQQVNNALARVNKLTQSILAKAFRGELTEKWRKDNPELISGTNSAEALLERIKAVPKTLTIQRKNEMISVKKKTGKSMNEIIGVVEALEQASEPLSGQQLLTAAGYPSNSNTEDLEAFFLDLREALLVDQSIIQLPRDNDNQDWFTLIGMEEKPAREG